MYICTHAPYSTHRYGIIIARLGVLFDIFTSNISAISVGEIVLLCAYQVMYRCVHKCDMCGEFVFGSSAVTPSYVLHKYTKYTHAHSHRRGLLLVQ